jgi:SNF2 family DNA or RNA helicase
MLVLHSIWDMETFCLWAESSLLPLAARKSSLANSSPNPSGNPSENPSDNSSELPAPHPFALSGLGLKSHLSSANDFRLQGESVQTLTLRLPSSKKGPLPSPWLLRDDSLPEKATSLRGWTVQALAQKAPDALAPLLDLPVSPSPGMAFADSLSFYSRLALFSLELVAREQFRPALIKGKAKWTAVIDEEDEARLEIFVASLPPSCFSCMSQGESQPQSVVLVRGFMDAFVDALVRRSIRDVALLPVRRGRPAKAHILARQFLHALSAKEASLEASAEELASFSQALDAWTLPLCPTAVDVPFRTCFRLEAPLRSVESWTLHFLLQAKDDRSLQVPAEDVWRTKSDAFTLLKKRLKNPQEQLLADLGKAARILPQLKQVLEQARPVSLEMEKDEAYSFLRQTAPLLEQSGFGVLLPAWWERPSARLGVKLRLTDAPEKESKEKKVGTNLLGLNSLVSYNWELSLGDHPLSEAEFMELSRLKVPLVQMRGEWMELLPGEVEAAIKFFQDSRRRNREMTLGEALRLGLRPENSIQLKSVPTTLPVIGLQTEGRIKELIGALRDPGTQMRPAENPIQFRGTLRPYQLRGVSWLEYLQRFGLGACLADDMGLGKTVEVIAFLLREREKKAAEGQAGSESDLAPLSPEQSNIDQSSIDKSSIDQSSVGDSPMSKPSIGAALLICPMSVAGNWQRELERFSPTLRVLLHHGLSRLSGQHFREAIEKNDVVITTYALAQRDEEDLSSVSWSHIILDEAQSIKNQTARQTQAVKRLKAENRIALTGTPVENRISELWSIMDFLNPGYLGSAASFHRDFVLPIEKYKDKSRSDALRSLISPFVLRRLKTDAAIISDLPEKLELKAAYSLTPEQATLYAAVVEEMMQRIESSAGIERRGQILSALTKLKQICNHPALFLQDGSPLGGRSGKLSRLEEMLYEVIAASDRALIFTQFAGMGAMLRHHFQEKLGVEVLFLHGKTSKKERDAMIQSFQSGGAPIFVLSLKAGGFGLNLTAANRVFHFDRWWNPAVENQATDRAFRIGQQRNVFVHKFVCLGTLEEKIDQMIEQKKALAESVLGSGEGWLTELPDSALREILMLRREAVAQDQEGDED